MIMQKLQQRSRSVISSSLSSPIGLPSSFPKIISLKRLDDGVESDGQATTHCNSEYISPDKPYRIPSHLPLASLGSSSKMSPSICSHFFVYPISHQSSSEEEDGQKQINIQRKSQGQGMVEIDIGDNFAADKDNNHNNDVVFDQQDITRLKVNFKQSSHIDEQLLSCSELQNYIHQFEQLDCLELNFSNCIFESSLSSSSSSSESALAQIILASSSIRELSIDFSHCQIQETYFQHLFQSLINNPESNDFQQRLTSFKLNFSGSNLSRLSCVFLSHFIGSMHNLNNLHIDLSESCLSVKSVSLFAYHISTLANLKELSWDLARNHLSDQAAESIEEHLNKESLQLHHLALDLNENQTTAKSLKLLGQFLKAQKQLNSLSLKLKNSNISSIDTSSLCSSLSKMLSLQNLSLDLSNNNLDDNFSNKFGNSISSLRGIQSLKLDLSGNNLQSNGLSFLNNLFKMQDLSILHLNLKDNHIGNGIGYSLAAQIFFSHQLNNLKLDLSNNGMASASVECLLQQLQGNPQMQQLHINLSGNEYHSVNAKNLFDIIMSNEILCDVEILPKNGFKGEQEEQECQYPIELIEEAARQKKIQSLQCVAFRQNIAKYLQGNIFDIYEDLSLP